MNNNNNKIDPWEFENIEEKTKFINRIISNNLKHFFFIKKKLEYDNRYNKLFNINDISNWDIWYSYDFNDFSHEELNSYPQYPY